MPTEPQVEIVGPPSAELVLQTPPADQPFPGMGAVQRGSRGIDRSVWAVQRLAVGGPALPAYMVPFQDEGESAADDDSPVYWTLMDLLTSCRSGAEFPMKIILFPITLWPWWEVDVPPAPESPYRVPAK